MRLGHTFGRIAFFLSVAAMTLTAGLHPRAVEASSLYDMNSMLNEAHPFGNRFGTRWSPSVAPTVTPTAPVPSAAPSYSAPAYSSPAASPVPVSQPSRYADPAPQPSRYAADEDDAAPKRSAKGRRGTGIQRTNEVGEPLWGVITQVSGGVFVHDYGPASKREEEGLAAHVEIRFKSPEFLDIIWSPELHIGGNLSTAHQTSQVFIGINYEWFLWRGLFAGFSLGGAWHDGRLTAFNRIGRKELGCRYLFRESINLGYAISDHHKIDLYLDHISNASLCSVNEGLENTGIRYSYRF